MRKTFVTIGCVLLFELFVFAIFFSIFKYKSHIITKSFSDNSPKNSESQFVISALSTSEASSIKDLTVSAVMDKNSVSLSLIETDPGMFYLFLPSSARTFYFSNLSENSILEINGKIISTDKTFFADELPTDNSIIKFTIDGLTESGNLNVIKSENISSVFIDTSVSQTELDSQKGIEYPGYIAVVDPAGVCSYSGFLDYIRTRGNTTFTDYEKKPYQIKTYETTTLLNMPQSKKWVLLANESDETYMWNSIVYDFARNNTEIPSPQGQFIDLFINGQYRGNYYLCQKVDSDLVNVKDGFLLEYGPLYQADEDEVLINIDWNNGLFFKYPQNPSNKEYEYIKNLFEETLEAIYSPDGINPTTQKHYSQYIDVNSFIDFYLIGSCFCNADNLASIFLYIDSSDEESLIKAGPIWDYDKAFLNESAFDVWLVDTYGYTFIANRLIERSEFVSLCKERFENTFKPYFSFYLPEILYERCSNLEASFKMNYVLWGTPGVYSSCETMAKNMLSRCDGRISVMDSEIFNDSNTHLVFFNGGNAQSISYRLVEDGCTIDNIPYAINYSGLFLGWYREDNGVRLRTDTPIFEDCTYVPKFLDISYLLLNGEDLAELSEDEILELYPENFEGLAELIRKQQEDILERRSSE